MNLRSLFLSATVGLTLTATAQTASTGIVFTTSAEATALSYHGATVAASHVTESFDLIDWGLQKGNSLSLEGHEITSNPFNSYLGGVSYRPDLSTMLAKTNIPTDSLQIFLQGAAGVSTFPTTSNHISFLAGGGLSYRMTPNLSWSTIDFHYLRIGSQNAWEASSGIVYTFNPQASKSMAMKRLLLKRTLRAQQ